MTYGSGSFSGESRSQNLRLCDLSDMFICYAGTEYTDTVTLSSSLVITNQSIGVASKSSGFSGYDGILGIGPDALTEGTSSVFAIHGHVRLIVRL